MWVECVYGAQYYLLGISGGLSFLMYFPTTPSLIRLR